MTKLITLKQLESIVIENRYNKQLIKAHIEKLGFYFYSSGIDYDVWISDNSNYVIKLLIDGGWGRPCIIPKEKIRKIREVYLFPSKTFRGNSIVIQRKAKMGGMSVKHCKTINRKIKRNKLNNLFGDIHSGNIGEIDNKIKIIDLGCYKFKEIHWSL